jgi:hypothetical protein
MESVEPNAYAKLFTLALKARVSHHLIVSELPTRLPGRCFVTHVAFSWVAMSATEAECRLKPRASPRSAESSGISGAHPEPKVSAPTRLRHTPLTYVRQRRICKL